VQVLGNDIPWATVGGAFRQGRVELQRGRRHRPSGDDATRRGARGCVNANQLNAADRPNFKAVRLPARATLDVTSQVNAYTSYNVIGRLRGSGRTGESLLYLGHWDHLGICRPKGQPTGSATARSTMRAACDDDRGGARASQGQASGARCPVHGDHVRRSGVCSEPSISALSRPCRSSRWSAAINIDTVAIAPAGEPVAIVGRGTTPLDPIVDATARELGRTVDADEEANAFIQRQDGYVLTRAGVPTVMVGGSFSNMGKLGAFLSGPYHKPEDDLSRPIELGGAVEDTNLLIALGRKLADPKLYPTPAR
jgi:hypothetical protein